MTSATTSGRETVQFVEFVLPKCTNTFGVSPCTATASDPSTKCFNTRATCQDVDNYRQTPEGHLSTSDVYYNSQAVPGSIFDGTADLFAAIDVYIPSDGAGVIWEQGGPYLGLYLGIDSGNIVLYAGAPAGSTSVTATADFSAYLGTSTTLLVGIDMTALTATIWAHDAVERTVTELATGTASGTIGAGNWTGSQDGALGRVNGNYIGTYDDTDFNGYIYQARFYDSTSAPDMSGDFVQSIYFSRGLLAERDIAPYALPMLKTVSPQAATINIGGVDENQSGLGIRATTAISMMDAKNTDRVIDPYLSDRTYDPLDRATFWTAFPVRYKYRYNVLIREYDGYKGQTLSQMQKRAYIMHGISGPDEAGNVSVTGKDVMANLEERKSQVPLASSGVLYADILSDATTFEVTGAETYDYPSTGVVRINDELISYSAVTDSANGIEFTVRARGYGDTEAAGHTNGDTVQECVIYSDRRVLPVLRELLVKYGNVPYQYIDEEQIQSEASSYLSFMRVDAVLSEPESVSDMVAEICRQFSIYMWWDERAQKIKARAIRGQDEDLDTLTYEDNIIAGSFVVTDRTKKRVSRVQFRHSRKSPIGDISDPGNMITYIKADLASESSERFGTPSIATINSRWISKRSTAQSTSSRIVRQYADEPRQIGFKMDAKDRQYWVGDLVKISHPNFVDAYKERDVRAWIILSARETKPGEEIEYVAEDVSSLGIVFQVQEDGAADYVGDGSDPTYGAFIGDDDGLLPDGTACATIG